MLMNKLINPEEAATLLGICKDTLNVWRSTKRYNLPFVKIGRKVMYRVDDINSFIEQNTQNNYS